MASPNGRSQSVVVDPSMTADNSCNVSASNNTSITFSPVRPVTAVKVPPSKVSSTEFAEQIKRLESEGYRFAAVRSEINLDHDSASAGTSPFRPSQGGKSDTESETRSPTVAPSQLSNSTLAALVDVQADQKTIAELRTQLECQQKETERLQRQLSGEFSTHRVIPSHLPFSLTTAPHMSAVGSLAGPTSAFATVPALSSSASMSALTSAHRTFDRPPPSHLEKALKDSQEQVMSLRKRLVEVNELGEQQKRHFRTTIEDLKSKLQETVANRGRILELRQQEAGSQESLILKLEANLKEFQEVNKHQEMVILEGNKKVDDLHHRGYLTDSALSQIRLLLSDAERRRGKPFYESEPISKQNPAALVHTLEKCLKDFEVEIDVKKSSIEKLQTDISEVQTQHSRSVEGMTREHQDRLNQLVTDHAKQLETAMERASNAREQSSNLQTQLDLLKQQYEQQLGLREETIRAQEVRLDETTGRYEAERCDWIQQREELEQRLTEMEEELSPVRLERAESARIQAELEAQIDSQQTQISELQKELSSAQDTQKLKLKGEEEMEKVKENLEKQVSDQQKEISQLEKMLALSKQESNLQLLTQAANLEKTEQIKASEKINTLTNQLSAMSQKADTAILDVGVARTEVNTLKLQVTELNNKLQVCNAQLEATTEAKGHLQKALEDKTSEISRVTEERDYYCHLVEEKNTELGEIKSERDKVIIQLEENDRNLKTIYQQSSNLSQIVEINSKASETVRGEKERLLKELTEKAVTIEELKLLSEDSTKKLKSREKRLKEIDADKQRLSLNLESMKQDVIRIRQERDKTVEELKQYKYHISMVADERNKQLATLKTEKNNLEKQSKKLSAKYKACEEELRLAQKTLQSRDSVDNKAVKVADKMQKEVTAKRGEVDKLHSQAHWMEEKIEALTKDKKSVEGMCRGLQDKLDKLTNENTALCRELSKHKRKHQDLKVRASKLQSGLEKAAVKNSAAQRQAEEQEQEIARLKLHHQLEIKEVQTPSGGQSSKPGQLDQPVLSSKKVSKSSVRQPAVSEPHQDQFQSLQTFNEIGSQLKSLLCEVKSLISTQGIGSPKVKELVTGTGDLEFASPPKAVTQWEVEAERIRNLTSQPHKHSSGETKWASSSPSRSHPCLSQTEDVSLQSLSLSEISSGTDWLDVTRTGSQSEHKSQTNHSNSGHKALFSHSQNSNNNNRSEESCPESPPRVTDTWALCKRLEAKMECLSQMGGSLQRENREMADLIKVQGKKLQRVRNSENKVHKKR